MASPLLFHVFRPDGSVTGPHPSAALRRELESGAISLDTQICMDGTQDWLPLSDWADEIQPPPPPRQLSTQTAAYIQAANTPPKNTPLRIFWGVILLLMGFVQGSLTFSFFRSGEFEVFIGSAVMTVVWSLLGSRLMSPPKRKI